MCVAGARLPYLNDVHHACASSNVFHLVGACQPGNEAAARVERRRCIGEPEHDHCQQHPQQTDPPPWISVLQVLLILIMSTQVYEFYLDHEAVRASGITIDTVADRRLACEFAARTLTMALVSAAIVAFQRVELFIAMFLMTLLREGQETIIDPLFPTANAPGFSPTADFVMHLVIVGVHCSGCTHCGESGASRRTKRGPPGSCGSSSTALSRTSRATTFVTCWTTWCAARRTPHPSQCCPSGCATEGRPGEVCCQARRPACGRAGATLRRGDWALDRRPLRRPHPAEWHRERGTARRGHRNLAVGRVRPPGPPRLRRLVAGRVGALPASADPHDPAPEGQGSHRSQGV